MRKAVPEAERRRCIDNPADLLSQATYSIAIVGMGPRGLSVLEALAAHLLRRTYGARLRIYLIDAAGVTPGRVWRQDQPSWLMMNTIVGELTMFSGRRDGGMCRPGAGCTLAEWLTDNADPELAALGPDDYAPRRVYGDYLRHVYTQICVSLRDVAELVEVGDRVAAIRDDGQRYLISLSGRAADPVIRADAVVLATGHSPSGLSGNSAALAAVASRVPGLRFLGGDIVTELDLAGIPAGTAVGVVGLGLSFYDLALTLTLGRGGEFYTSDEGILTYRPSGHEPTIVAGSRSGMLIGTRGRNQKRAGYTFRPRFLTPRAIAGLRERAVRESGAPALSFGRDVMPLLQAEVNYVYYTSNALRRGGQELAERIGQALTGCGSDIYQWSQLASGLGLDNVQPIEFEGLGRPFAGRLFSAPEDFCAEFCKTTFNDIAEAKLGNIDGPLKAALDAVRDAREMIRMAIEFGGLTGRSQRDEFHDLIEPLILLLTTGPPPVCTERVMALVAAGIVRVAGPETTFRYDGARRTFVVESRYVKGSRVHVRVLVDARVPAPGIRRSANPLIRQLLADGLIREFVSGGPDSRTAGRCATGGLQITPAENRVVLASGAAQRAMYAVGIPTEGVRWFTQIGNGRPGSHTLFEREAGAIALSLVRVLFLRSAGPGRARASPARPGPGAREPVADDAAHARRDGHPATYGPVERAMLGHPAVREVAVVSCAGPSGAPVTKAYVVLAAGWNASAATAGAILARVGTAMRPAAAALVEFVDLLPRTRSGEIDRHALRRYPRSPPAEFGVPADWAVT